MLDGGWALLRSSPLLISDRPETEIFLADSVNLNTSNDGEAAANRHTCGDSVKHTRVERSLHLTGGLACRFLPH